MAEFDYEVRPAVRSAFPIRHRRVVHYSYWKLTASYNQNGFYSNLIRIPDSYILGNNSVHR